MKIANAFLLAGIASLSSTAASAADELKFGPRPAWVVPQTVPRAAANTGDQPVTILLQDQQSLLEPGKISTYSELAFKIQKPEGLAAGNLSVQWNPATDSVTIHRVEILRGNQLIDVLKAGQTFTTLRRESNLELAMLDGVLTATIQPEGLQEGDTVIFATTSEHSDPVLKGHVETNFAPWSSSQIRLAHARLSWPSTLDLKIKRTGDLATPSQGKSAGRNSFDLTMRDVEPLIPPRAAPVRYAIGRMGEATDFRSWAEAADLVAPLYREAAVIPPSGPLRDELEKIRKASGDPKIRAGLALQLVEQRVRYVALLMGEGGLVPAPAEVTWSRRFGDCKGKTVLLLALLHELGIDAEPVLVNSGLGDAVGDRLPMIGLFDHVLVRAHVAGQTYWLDGTRTGETKLDNLQTPNLGWGLPLVAEAALVRITPAPARKPQSERVITIDASAGVYAPAKVTIEHLFRGSDALVFNMTIAKLAANQRDELLKMLAKRSVDWMEVSSVSAKMDAEAAEFRMSATGTGKLDWRDGWFTVPAASIAYEPNFERAAGPTQKAPFATDFPTYETAHVVLRLPPGFLARQEKIPAPVHETVAGIEYARTATITGDVLTVDTSERTIVPEISYQEAKAAEGRLKALSNDDVYLHASNSAATDADVKALTTETPASAQAYIDRGLIFLDRQDYDKAIADFTNALKLDSNADWALGDRAIAYVWKKDDAAANKDLAALEKLDPKHRLIFHARGIRAELMGDYKGAVEQYSKAIAVDPKDDFAINRRSMAYVVLRDMDKALADNDRALSLGGNSAANHALRAQILIEQGKREEAAGEAEAIAKTEPVMASHLIGAARIMADAGKPDRAQLMLDQADRMGNLSAREIAGEASVLNALGKWDLALAATDKALKAGMTDTDLRLLRLNLMMRNKRARIPAEIEAMLKESPQSDYAFVVAGKTYAALGMNDRAMKAFDRAIELKPEAYVYINRSQSRPKTDTAGRLADVEAALKLSADDPDALIEKSQILSATGDYPGAIAALDRIESTNDPSVRSQRAFLLAKAGRTDEARKLFETVRASATSPMELNNLCYSKATAGILLESALEDCRQALKLSPDMAGVQDSLGMVLLKLDKLDEAIAAYSQALAKSPIPGSYMGRALAYARKGNAAAAKKDRAEANRLSPEIETVFAGYGLKFDTPPPPAVKQVPRLIGIAPQ